MLHVVIERKRKIYTVGPRLANNLGLRKTHFANSIFHFANNYFAIIFAKSEISLRNVYRMRGGHLQCEYHCDKCWSKKKVLVYIPIYAHINCLNNIQT